MAMTLHRTDQRNGVGSVYALLFPFIQEMSEKDATVMHKTYSNSLTRAILEGVKARDKAMSEDDHLKEVNAQIAKKEKAIDTLVDKQVKTIAETLGLSEESAERAIREARAFETASLYAARTKESGEHIESAINVALTELMGEPVNRVTLKDTVVIAFFNQTQGWPNTAFVYGPEKDVVQYVLRKNGENWEEIDTRLRGLSVKSIAQCHQCHYGINGDDIETVLAFWGNGDEKSLSYKTGVNAPSVTKTVKRNAVMREVTLFPEE
jgi:hypothetical protein